MSDLKSRLETLVSAAFEAEGLPGVLGRVSASDRPDLADFQTNGALAAAKLAGRAPREIAARIVERLSAAPEIETVEAAGPGFVNFRIAGPLLETRTAEALQDGRAGADPAVQGKVVVDYGGPNVAKPMHVGHLRASIIGESLKRILRFSGRTVVGDAHFGDWGFQMGLLIVAVGDEGRAQAFLSEGDGPFPEASPVSLADLERLYPLAAARAKSDPEYRDRARRATAQLQAGRPGYRALWRKFVEVSRSALEREFHALGVDFDLWNGESDVDPLIPEMIADLRDKGLLIEDQGALIVRVARPDEKRELPPLLVVSSEGSAMYGTTDLATILDRRRKIDPDEILYVVDQRQADHFTQVFRAAVLAGYAREGELEHIGFGTMNGPDGRPFKTREGGVLKLDDLITQAVEKARLRLQEAELGGELPPEEFAETARRVAVAALKFADLSNHRTTSYVFDIDRFTSFEGKTGPYLLYQAVRIKSLLRKAAETGLEAGPIRIGAPAERDLALVIDAFAGAVREAGDRRAPNLIAEHSYRLAQSFSKFYAACPILSAETPDAKGARLALSQAALLQMTTALELLGIEAPERM